MIRECKTHGKTKYVKYASSKCYRCTKCISDAVTKSRRKRKQDLVDIFGGKCQLCGYNKYIGALQFHHIDPSTKEFGLSASGFCRSFERMLAEAKKCVLLCSNCHVEVENGIVKLPERLIGVGSSVVRAFLC